jgi:hypothetical protein
MDNKQEVVSKIKEIALAEGIDSARVEALAEKCYDSIPSWKPYSGATSFDQIDQQRAVGEYSSAISEQTYELRGIVDNITDSPDFSHDEKANAIKAAADDFKKRVSAIPVPTAAEVQADPGMGTKEEMSFLDHVKSFFVKDGKKTDTPIRLAKGITTQDLVTSQAKNLLRSDLKEGLGTGFKVFRDNKGEYRWLSFSSNAFEDNQKELFTTAALEEAVEHADKTGQRGPLLYFHVKSAEIGQCDLQVVQGRFLIESGTFNDTPLGQKALEYLLDTDEEQQVSIGFKYRLGDEADGQYDWFRFNERSVLPSGLAANPFTQFFVFGEEDKMNPVKEAAMETVFGKDMTKEIVSAANSRTKELEEAGVKFKEVDLQSVDFGEITGERQKEAPVTEVIEHEHGDVIHTHIVEAGKTHLHGEGVAFKAKKMPMDAEDDPKKGGDNGADEDQEDAQGNKKGKKEDESAVLLALKDLGAKIGNMQSEIKELQKSDDEKVAAVLSPRATSPEGTKPSEDKNNLIGDEANYLPEGLREQLKDLFSDGSKANPAAVWASDIVHGPQSAAN